MKMKKIEKLLKKDSLMRDVLDQPCLNQHSMIKITLAAKQRDKCLLQLNILMSLSLKPIICLCHQRPMPDFMSINQNVITKINF